MERIKNDDSGNRYPYEREFEYQTLKCPRCGNIGFLIVNTGVIICRKCMKLVEIIGRYEDNGKEKILRSQKKA